MQAVHRWEGLRHKLEALVWMCVYTCAWIKLCLPALADDRISNEPLALP